jgi:DNA-binding transcriptional ArsR family regulator
MRTQYIRSLPPRWEKYSRLYHALGDPQRQKILLLFEAGERLTIKQIADAFPVSRTAVVHHLRVLQEAGVLRRSRAGREVRLWIDKRRVVDTIQRVARFIEQHA